MSFTYDFENNEDDETYFAYCFPYSFTKLSNFLKNIKQ